MGWCVGGYACGVHAVFIAIVVLSGMRGASVVGFLLAVPTLTLALGGIGFFRGDQADQEAVLTALESGRMRRREPFAAGLFAAFAGLALCYVAARTDVFWTDSIVVAVFVFPLLLILPPVASCSWVIVRARVRANEPMGFPVIPSHQVTPVDDVVFPRRRDATH